VFGGLVVKNIIIMNFGISMWCDLSAPIIYKHKAKAVPLHIMKALGGEELGGIAPTYS
jgi:hypothetical protein